MAERIIRNSGLPPKFLLSPTEQTGRGFFVSMNRESANNPITAAPSDPSPSRSFWETWNQSPKSKFIPLSLKQLHCFELQGQEAKGNSGEILLSHILIFFQRQEVIVALLWELSSHQGLAQMIPTTSPWAPLPRILWGVQTAPPALPPLGGALRNSFGSLGSLQLLIFQVRQVQSFTLESKLPGRGSHP